jgi:hypothetical protein
MQCRRRPWVMALAYLLGLAAVVAIILAVWKLPSLLYGDISEASPDARLQAASSFRTALIAGLAGLAALGSLAMATRTYRLAQQGQITDRYAKAIEQLGSENLDVRLGGIYALERIGKDSAHDEATIAECSLHTSAAVPLGRPPDRTSPARTRRSRRSPSYVIERPTCRRHSPRSAANQALPHPSHST